jgi:predicted phage terminase large subunit-like protein
MTSLRPQPGPQTAFLSTPADIAGYGGAAGGGKTFAMLLEPLRHINNPNFGGVIFRRTFPQIKSQGGLWDESAKIYPLLGATPRVSDLQWVFPSGAKVTFAHMQHEKDKFSWQGSQIPFIGFDEATHFEEEQFFYMLSRNRQGSCAGVQPYIRLTCNPDAASWVKVFFAPWLDRRFEEKTGGKAAKSGEIRYFVRVGGNIEWLEPSDPRISDPDPTKRPKSVTFVHSSIYDNKILLKNDPAYLQNLESLPVIERERLLRGNWDIEEGDKLFERDWFPIVENHQIPHLISKVRYWDMAGTAASERASACYTSGVLMGKSIDNRIYILDVKRVQYDVWDAEELVLDTAQADGPDVEICMEQEPGSSGKKVIADFTRKLIGYTFRGDRPTGDKITRAKPLVTQARAGNLYLVRGAWNKDFLDEVDEYPLKMKDQVDAASGALAEVANVGGFAFA